MLVDIDKSLDHVKLEQTHQLSHAETGLVLFFLSVILAASDSAESDDSASAIVALLVLNFLATIPRIT